MTHLNEPVHVRRWQAAIAVAMSGFALGTILAKIAASLGI